MEREPERRIEAKLIHLFEEAKRWSGIWGLTRLMRDVQIEFSREIGPALGRCDLRRMTITLNGLLLLEGNEALLFETLCHELAHVVAAVRYGTRIAEHGPEWSDYMEKAGFAPRPVIPESLVVGLQIQE
jgi:predicted SprT family Zn-dependent metalloprotease